MRGDGTPFVESKKNVRRGLDSRHLVEREVGPREPHLHERAVLRHRAIPRVVVVVVRVVAPPPVVAVRGADRSLRLSLRLRSFVRRPTPLPHRESSCPLGFEARVDRRARVDRW